VPAETGKNRRSRVKKDTGYLYKQDPFQGMLQARIPRYYYYGFFSQHITWEEFVTTPHG
jgi:hypothetical protein